MGWYAGLHIHGDASFAYQPFFDTGCTRLGLRSCGNGEMYPLNGLVGLLFFEYIGNIMYALFIRRMSTKALTALVVGGNRIGFFVRYIQFFRCGPSGCGVDDGRIQSDRWFLACVIFFLYRIINVARF